MKLSWENFRWYALVCGLAAVLGVLAFLQYRSIKQVSSATTEQMRANLRGSLADVRQGLERELAPICREMQSPTNSANGDLPQEYAARFERWRRAAAHPGLVSEVYLWTAAPGQQAQLLKLNSSRNAFEVANWPERLSALHRRLQELSTEFGPGGPAGPEQAKRPPPEMNGNGGSTPPDARSPQQDPRRPPRMNHRPPPDGGMNRAGLEGSPTFWSIDQHIPALVHRAMVEDGESHSGPEAPSWIVVVLNREVLSRDIFPELVERYFGKSAQSSYQVAIQGVGEPSGTLYSSDDGFGDQGEAAPDAELNLFGPPQAMAGHAQVSELRVPIPSHFNEFRLAAGASTIGVHNEDRFVIDPIHYAAGDQDWEIIAKHRKGSVEAAVAALYHRNLLINFGVLVVLATTIGLIIATTQRAQRLAQLQMDFVAGVSHELRTPLTGIVSAAQNIADGVVDDKERVMRYGAAITSQAQQLSDLVEQILLFSATQKEKYRYHLQPVDAGEVIGAALSSTAGLIRAAGFTIEQVIPPGLPPVLADFKALSHVLQNLIANSVKYGGEARWVGIRAAVDDSGEAGELTISVEDEGIGIGGEEIHRIFEPFYRSPAVTEAQIHGTGLGLPLAKNITEAMGGKLTVESEAGRGSTFTVHLPIANEHDGKNSSAKTTAPARVSQ